MIKYDLIWSDLIIHDIPGWCNDFKWNAWNATNTPKKRNETTADKEKNMKQKTAKQATWKSQEHKKMRNKAKGNEIIRTFWYKKKQLP